MTSTADGSGVHERGQRVGVADVEVGVSGEDAIGQEVAQLRLRPIVNDELGDQVQVGARIDVVRDASGDDGEDGCGALSAEVEPGEEPIPGVMGSSP